MAEDKSPYAAAANVPIIKSPSLRVPKPVTLPPDIHPLPDSVTAYFVYPYTLEPHILTTESSRRSTLAAHAARRDAYLQAREDEKERRKREALRKIAPGFDPRGVLVPTPTPTRNASISLPISPDTTGSRSNAGDGPGHRHTKSVMEDLVDQLAALDSKKNS
ncbi:hypothetical protein K435DRAFT_962895 [Dendrothele bispora CBS 962.96]|uniref:Uncharacterized protein n=1 Tax=Dendrothele bispora (strain CBS 962.96) TaxID=1314807 RepID=A0A4S8MIL2_DENBC|nr:hypothetical protein K435DRAFT_962895 [Dendrothele bispora CBS 962.96]